MKEPDRVMGTMLPESFLPWIGLVMIKHALLDRALNAAICHVAGLDFNAGVPLLSRTPNTTARGEILRSLATTKLLNDVEAIKAHVLADLIKKYSDERNILAHGIPYWSNAAGDEIGYFRDENRTFPQIKIKPPYRASVRSIAELARQMDFVCMTLGEILPFHTLDDSGKPITSVHKAWANPENFAWPDLYSAKASKWKRVKELPAAPSAGSA